VLIDIRHCFLPGRSWAQTHNLWNWKATFSLTDSKPTMGSPQGQVNGGIRRSIFEAPNAYAGTPVACRGSYELLHTS